MKKTEEKKLPKPTNKMTTLPSCFRPSTTPALEYYPHAPPSTTATTANLTTSLYQTPLGMFSLTWSQSLFTRSLHLNLHAHPNHLSPPSPAFHLSLKPFFFLCWNNKQGVKKLCKSTWVFWDLSNARFGSGPEPESRFYIAIVFQGSMTLLVGDMEKEAYLKTKVKKDKKTQSLVLRREHILGKNKFYSTRVNLGGKRMLISIELIEYCDSGPKLVIKFDQKREIEVKHLKWKFRGSERIEIDGESIQLSWDVYNWLFDIEDSSNQDDGCALFTFRFEKQGNHERETEEGASSGFMWGKEDSCGLKYERNMMKKKMNVKTMRNSSFSSNSVSSVSSSVCSSSVLEWESVEENELKGPTGFSLLVYAWKN